MIPVRLLVEGNLDAAVARRLVESVGLDVSTVHGRRGFGYIKRRLPAFSSSSSAYSPLLALVDLMDTGLGCAPTVIDRWLPRRPSTTLLRVVVREIESWLLADIEHLAPFLRVAQSLLPRAPEALPDPKQALVNLARRSGSARLRKLLVPRGGNGNPVGEASASRSRKRVRRCGSATARVR